MTRKRRSMTPSERAERFWSRVDVRSKDECWNWLGHILTHSGYGQYHNGTKKMLAHRMSWELTFGPIPNGPGYHGFCVCHSCDNKPCVNPTHLFLGTQLDNMRDCKAKGRKAQGDKHWTRLYPGSNCGEANGRAKLNEQSVKAIRLRTAAGETRSSLSRVYGVSRQVILCVVSGRNWAHV